MRITSLFPFLNWPRPTAESMQRDVWAGITVGFVLVPQALAYATLAGMPPHTGLYAALIPSVIGILFGSSPLLAVGPVALTSLLVFSSLTSIAVPGSDQWVSLAIWLAIYSGLFQILFGLCKVGRAFALVSQPVLIGFTNAAALIIIVSQLPALIGLSSGGGQGLIEHIVHLPDMPKATLFITSLFGVSALLMLAALKKFAPHFPNLFCVLIIGIAASYAVNYAKLGGAIVRDIPSGLPHFLMPPAMPFELHRQLIASAFVVAVVSFVEAMSSCRTLARSQKTTWDENQELIGQGLAKISSALSGAFPVSGSFSRSALNVYAGAASAWSTLFAAACVLIALLFLSAPLYFLPKAVLAAMIMVPVFGLVKVSAFRRLFAISKDDATVALVTFIVTLFSMPHLYWGVFVGTGLATLFFLYRRMHPRIIEVAMHEDGTLRDRARFALPRIAPDVFGVRMDSALNYITAPSLERFITEKCREDRSIKQVLLCAGSINDIDSTGIDMLEALVITLRGEGVDLFLTSVKIQVWRVMQKAGIAERLRPAHVFSTDQQAVFQLATPHGKSE